MLSHYLFNYWNYKAKIRASFAKQKDTSTKEKVTLWNNISVLFLNKIPAQAHAETKWPFMLCDGFNYEDKVTYVGLVFF